MSESIENLWDCARLAAFLGQSTETVRANVYRRPDSVPPPVRGVKPMRWLRSVCEDWARRQSEPVSASDAPLPVRKGKMGRRRKAV